MGELSIHKRNFYLNLGDWLPFFYEGWVVKGIFRKLKNVSTPSPPQNKKKKSKKERKTNLKDFHTALKIYTLSVLKWLYMTSSHSLKCARGMYGHLHKYGLKSFCFLPFPSIQDISAKFLDLWLDVYFSLTLSSSVLIRVSFSISFQVPHFLQLNLITSTSWVASQLLSSNWILHNIFVITHICY